MSDRRSLGDDRGHATTPREDEPREAEPSAVARFADDSSGNEREGLSRRTLLTRGGAVIGGVAVAGAVAPAVAAQAKGDAVPLAEDAKAKKHTHHNARRTGWADPTVPRQSLKFFSVAEANVIGALANRIYPKDKLGPGATDLGVVEYIDGQLSGPWGTGERMYRQGPFVQPTDSGHGWQYAMTPGDAYRVALESLQRYTEAKHHGNTYDLLSTKQQDKILGDLASGSKALDPYFDQLAAADFFSMFYANVKEGLFADPSYGGNRGVEGWKLIRYPGDPMARGDNNFKYVTDFSYYPPGPPRAMDPGV